MTEPMQQTIVREERQTADGSFSPRQAEVLDATLRELVAGGHALTMTAVARRASCSKETLYKWFGDREGLLRATVAYQAARVHVASVDAGGLDLGSLQARLEEFAANWLRVISSDTSIALNRVAIAEAGGAEAHLGGIVLEKGRFALGARLKIILEAGRAAGLLSFDDPRRPSGPSSGSSRGMCRSGCSWAMGSRSRPRSSDPTRRGPRGSFSPSMGRQPRPAQPADTQEERRRPCAFITTATRTSI